MSLWGQEMLYVTPFNRPNVLGFRCEARLNTEKHPLKSLKQRLTQTRLTSLRVRGQAES